MEAAVRIKAVCSRVHRRTDTERGNRRQAGKHGSNGNKSPGLQIPKETPKLQLLPESNFTSRRTRYFLNP